VKKLEQELLSKEQDNASLTHKLSIAEADLDKAEAKLSEAKHASEEGEQNKSANQELLRKVALLEDELDAAEKNLKDCNEKLRQVDVKAEHFERQVQRIETERDEWENKYNDAVKSHDKTKKELDELAASLEGL